MIRGLIRKIIAWHRGYTKLPSVCPQKLRSDCYHKPWPKWLLLGSNSRKLSRRSAEQLRQAFAELNREV